MKLDLTRANCREVSFSSEFSVSADTDGQIRVLTRETELVHIENTALEVAHYGSIYNVGDTTIGISGNLRRSEEADHSSYWFFIGYFVGDDDFPPPPDSWKPISDLLKIIADIPGEVEIDCEAMFTYALGDGVRSRVNLPAPLLLSNQSSAPSLTHIESVVLSRREEEQFTHTVGVELLDGGSSIMHTVDFSIRSALTCDSIRQIFEIAGRLSMSLIDYRSEEVQ